jgi:hypothetical protein
VGDVRSRLAVLVLGISGTTNVAAMPPSGTETEHSSPRAQASLPVAAALGAGAYFGRGRSRYDDGDRENMPSFDSHTGVGPGGWLALSVGGRLASRWRLSATLTLAVLAFPNRFTGEKERAGFASLGPELTFESMRGGAFAYVRPELAWWSERAAIVASVGGGYGWLVSEATTLGLGVQLSGLYSRGGEDADNGAYRYTDAFLAPSLILRVSRP